MEDCEPGRVSGTTPDRVMIPVKRTKVPKIQSRHCVTSTEKGCSAAEGSGEAAD